MIGPSEPTPGLGRAFGTFGELLQGVLPDPDRDFLVTLPIARYSRALFVPDPQRPDVTVLPPQKVRAREMAALLVRHFGLESGGILRIRSQLPMGKGMASSSADLVATARAVASALGRRLPTGVLLDLLRQIEPSDGVMFPGAVAFYHRKVRLAGLLGDLPPLTIVGTDEGGAVDTLAFNQIPKPFTAQDKDEYRGLLAELALAINDQNPVAIGRIATRSAVLNQKLLPKRHLEAVLRMVERVGGLGVAVAHSGTCLGALLSPAEPSYPEQLSALRRGLIGLTGNSSVYKGLSFADDLKGTVETPDTVS